MVDVTTSQAVADKIDADLTVKVLPAGKVEKNGTGEGGGKLVENKGHGESRLENELEILKQGGI